MSYRPLAAFREAFLKHSMLVVSAAMMLFIAGIAHPLAAPPHLAGDNQKPAKPDLTQRAQIRFLTGTDFAPFNSLTPEGRLSGYNIDLVRAICQELAITSRCQIEARPWNEHLSALKNDETDALIAGLIPDREKRATLSFTRPYLSLPARFIAAKTKQNDKSTFSPTHFSPDGKTVGVLSKTVHEALLKSYFPKTKIQLYTDTSYMYQDLKNGKIQLIFGDAMGLSLWMSAAISQPNSATITDGSCCQFIGGAYSAPDFLGQGMMITLRKQDADLRIAFDNALSSLERKGFLNDLYLRYFPIDFY